MATEVKEVRDFVRTVLGDSDSQRLLYSDATIDGHIKLLLIKENDHEIQVSPVPGEFTNDLTPTQKALTIYRTALSILSGQPDQFFYKSPVMSVSRKGGVLQLIAFINKQIADLQGGTIALAYDTELDAMINGSWRFLQDLQAAQANL